MILLKITSSSNEAVNYEGSLTETFVSNQEYDLETILSIKTQKGLAYITSLILQGKVEVIADGVVRDTTSAMSIARGVFDNHKENLFLINDKVELFLTRRLL